MASWSNGWVCQHCRQTSSLVRSNFRMARDGTAYCRKPACEEARRKHEDEDVVATSK